MTNNVKWTVTENNGGGITLFVWDDGDGNEYVHAGYEYIPNNLREDIAALYTDGNDVTEWDGDDRLDEEQAKCVRSNNGMDDLDLSEMYDSDGNLIPLTADDLYDDDDSTKVIAEGTADEIKAYPDIMGFAGRETVLGIKR